MTSMTLEGLRRSIELARWSVITFMTFEGHRRPIRKTKIALRFLLSKRTYINMVYFDHLSFIDLDI